jgi:hypothetical protein
MIPRPIDSAKTFREKKVGLNSQQSSCCINDAFLPWTLSVGKEIENKQSPWSNREDGTCDAIARRKPHRSSKRREKHGLIREIRERFTQ